LPPFLRRGASLSGNGAACKAESKGCSDSLLFRNDAVGGALEPGRGTPATAAAAARGGGQIRQRGGTGHLIGVRAGAIRRICSAFAIIVAP